MKENPDGSFTCECCGTIYDKLPLCFGADYPRYYLSIPPDERERRVELTESLCVIDEIHFFHRGQLTIPITDHDEGLVFNVWTSISEDNFRLRNDAWYDPERIKYKPYFGWLQTEVPGYPDTINIKTIAHENKVGYIPTIEVIEEEHDLFYDQLNGFTYAEALGKVQAILRRQHLE